MRNADTSNGYGWISIALHWTTAIVVLTVWFIGSSIQAESNPDSESVLRLHTSIAICAYALLWVRIVWRFLKGHPGPLKGQAGAFYVIGKYMHFVLLGAIALMLVSGPMMVWSRGTVIYVFDWFTIPGPFAMNIALFDTMHTVHVWCSRIIIIGTVLHLGGVYKHAAFNQDGTFGKMLVPQRKDESL